MIRFQWMLQEAEAARKILSPMKEEFSLERGTKVVSIS